MCARAEAQDEWVRLIACDFFVGLSLQTWVFHFSPQKSAPESQLLAKTGCWYAEIKSRTDKTSQAASTARLRLADPVEPGNDRVQLSSPPRTDGAASV